MNALSIENIRAKCKAGVDDAVHIVTAYYPDEIKFMPDMKTRRE